MSEQQEYPDREPVIAEYKALQAENLKLKQELTATVAFSKGMEKGCDSLRQELSDKAKYCASIEISRDRLRDELVRMEGLFERTVADHHRLMLLCEKCEVVKRLREALEGIANYKLKDSQHSLEGYVSCRDIAKVAIRKEATNKGA